MLRQKWLQNRVGKRETEYIYNFQTLFIENIYEVQKPGPSPLHCSKAFYISRGYPLSHPQLSLHSLLPQAFFLPRHLPPRSHHPQDGWHTPPRQSLGQRWANKAWVVLGKPPGALPLPIQNDLRAFQALEDTKASPYEMHLIAYRLPRGHKTTQPYSSCSRRPAGKQGLQPPYGALTTPPKSCQARHRSRQALWRQELTHRW